MPDHLHTSTPQKHMRRKGQRSTAAQRIENWDKLASEAGLWYNRGRNIVVSESATNTTQTLIHSLEECIMDSLPPRDLTPQERKKAYNQAYYRSHREEIRLQQKEYNEAHLDEIKKYGQEWRESHREYNNEVAKLDRQVNREAISVRRKAHYQENAERIKLQVRNYQSSHQEQVRARQRAHHEANFASHAARDRAYRLANMDRVRLWNKAIHARRRARLAQTGGFYTIQEWQALIVFYDHTCLCCKRREPEIKLTADHILPVSRGGSSYISNIQPLCGSCNSKKHDKIIDYRPRFERDNDV